MAGLQTATARSSSEKEIAGGRAEKEAVHTKIASATVGYPTPEDGLINASGHREQLDRNFNLISICSYAITAGNSWVSLGGTIVSQSILSHS